MKAHAYYVKLGGSTFSGPFTEEYVRQLLAAGTISRNTECFCYHWFYWQVRRVSDFPELTTSAQSNEQRGPSLSAPCRETNSDTVRNGSPSLDHGRPANAAAVVSAHLANAPVAAPSLPVQRPKGVGGWLLVLCIWMTIISPLFSFAKLHAMGETEMYLSLGLIVFSITAGIFLWCGKQVGVVLVRTLLILVLVLNLIAILMLLNRQQSERVVFVLFQSSIPIAWLVYLSASKRVRATYYE